VSGPITIDTPLGPGVIVFRSMVAHEALGQPFLFELEVLSTQANLKPSDLLGHSVSVHLETANFGTRHFTGLVSRFEYRGTGQTYSEYRLTLRPWLWFLGQTENSRVFQKVSVPTILSQIFAEYGPPGSGSQPSSDSSGGGSAKPRRNPHRGTGQGLILTDFTQALSELHPPLEYVVQYRETDLQFVTRLMERAGIYYFFRHYADKHELVLADAYGAHETALSYASLVYLPPDQHRHSAVEFVDGWRLTDQVRPGVYSHADFDFIRPDLELYATATGPKEVPPPGFEVYDYPGRFLENTAKTDSNPGIPGEAIAAIRLQQLQAPFEVVLGASNARGLAVGNLFSLTEHPRSDQNKEHLVVAAEYELHGHDIVTGGDDAHTFRCTFEARDSKVPFRMPIVTDKPVMRGPQTATVVGKDAEEIWTDEYGRVKVQFHWDREGVFDEGSSCFVRVAQVWAGDGWGAMHIPRIGQEVIVDFLEGDPDQPIVVGRVYNGKNMPPYALPKNQTQSGIRSRSSKGGGPSNFNELMFEDLKGSELFSMQAEKDQKTLVKNDQTNTIQGNRSSTITKSDSVSVGGDRSVTVTGNLSVTVKGGGKSPNHSELTVTGKHHVHASDTIEMDAPTHIKFTVGDSSVLIEPGKITMVSGGKATVVLDANVLAQSSDGTKIVLDKNALTSASTGATVALDDKVVATSKANSVLQLDSNAGLTTNGDVGISGVNVEADGKAQVTLKVASNSVQVSTSGTAVAGATVNVNGTGMVSIGGPIIKIG
jgi:type VI secretion system secreted protein VgrG